MYKSQQVCQPERPFEAWLFAILRKVASRLLRARQRLAFHCADGRAPGIMYRRQSSLELELREALEQLSPRQIEAFALTKLLSLSVAQAASRTGTSVCSMKFRVHRAYESLKRSLLG